MKRLQKFSVCIPSQMYFFSLSRLVAVKYSHMCQTKKLKPLQKKTLTNYLPKKYVSICLQKCITTVTNLMIFLLFYDRVSFCLVLRCLRFCWIIFFFVDTTQDSISYDIFKWIVKNTFLSIFTLVLMFKMLHRHRFTFLWRNIGDRKENVWDRKFKNNFSKKAE